MENPTTATPPESPKTANLFRRLLDNNSKTVIFLALAVSVVLITAASVALVYLCWFRWMAPVARWGFVEFSTINFGYIMLSILKAILAVFAISGLSVLPFFPFGGTWKYLLEALEIFTQERNREFERNMAENQKKGKYYEDILENKSKDGLIIWVNYSRIELDQYYKMGLQQARKSYRSSLVAMWLGFSIILIGMATRMVEIPGVVIPKDGQVSILTIAGGVVAELISALFLWIYRSSIAQLTYFYNRQIFVHNSLLAFEISKSMENSEDARKNIIEKIMDFGMVANPSLAPLGKAKSE